MPPKHNSHRMDELLASVTEDLLEAEGSVELPILSGGEIVLQNDQVEYSVYVNDSLQMKSVKMPLLQPLESGQAEADRMTHIMIFWETVKGLIKEHINEM